MPSIALPGFIFSSRCNVLIIVILHALLHDTIWMKCCVVQGQRYTDSSSNEKILQKSWNNAQSGNIKNSARLHNTFVHKLRGNQLYFESLRWTKNDKPITNRVKRDKLGSESGYRNINTSSSHGNILQRDIARNADFSYANLSKTVELKDLKQIQFPENGIHTMQRAKTLNLAHNDIEYIDESVTNTFTSIEHLDLAYNKIENFNLWIAQNDSTTFRFLKVLNLTGNRLRSFQSAQIKSLKGIDLSCNLFSEPKQFNLNPLIYLDYVDLSCNRLNTLHAETLQNVTNLKVLNLAGNRLSKINRNYFDRLINIEVLILSNNNINEIESDAFANLANLQFLDLTHNNLSAYSLHALQNIPGLSGLSVAHNKELGNALQGFVTSWKIKELDVSATGLFEIPAALAQSVHSLNLSRNHFTILRCGDLDSYPFIKNLDMSFCNINDIEDDAFGRLEILTTLNVNNNNLSRIPSSLPSRLVYLNLKNNRIVDINPSSFAQLSNLQILDLSGNLIMYVPGLPLPKLITLNLRSAYVKGLSQSVVKMSPRLKDIFLDDNPIKCSELLSIAEWATPCRIYKTEDTFFDQKEEHIEIVKQALHGFDSKRWQQQCCQQSTLLTNDAENQSELLRGIEFSTDTFSEETTTVPVKGFEYSISHISSYLAEALDTPENQMEQDRQAVPRSEEKLEITTVSELFPTDIANSTTINANRRNIPEFQSSSEVDSAEENKYRGERKNLESSTVVEKDVGTSSAVTISSFRHQSTEINAIPERKFANYMHSDDLLPVSNNIDHSNNLERLDNAPGGTSESLNDYRVTRNSSEIPTFLSIASGICFLVYIVYLYRCKRSHIQHQTIDKGIENGTLINVSHLQVDRLGIETIHADISDDLW